MPYRCLETHNSYIFSSENYVIKSAFNICTKCWRLCNCNHHLLLRKSISKLILRVSENVLNKKGFHTAAKQLVEELKRIYSRASVVWKQYQSKKLCEDFNNIRIKLNQGYFNFILRFKKYSVISLEMQIEKTLSSMLNKSKCDAQEISKLPLPTLLKERMILKLRNYSMIKYT